jgi:hypothetical protein
MTPIIVSENGRNARRIDESRFDLEGHPSPSSNRRREAMSRTSESPHPLHTWPEGMSAILASPVDNPIRGLAR